MSEIVDRIYFPFLEERPLSWQNAGLSYTASGYGRRIPTRYMVRHNGRLRRVYACCYSNTATCYIETKNKDWIIVEV